MSHKRRKLASGSLVVEFWASQGFLWQLGSLAQKDMEIERSAGGYDHGDGDGQRRRWRWP